MEERLKKYADDLFNNLTKNKKVQRVLLPIVSDEDPVAFEFKRRHTLKDRIIMYKELNANHPGKIPVVVECDGHKKILKLMVNWDERVSRLLITIRNKYDIPLNQAVFLITDRGTTLMGSQCFGDILRDQSANNGDLFIYLKVEHESTFGFFSH